MSDCGGYENRDHRACNGTGRRNGGICRDCNGLGYRVFKRHCPCCNRMGDHCDCWGESMDCNCGGRFYYDEGASTYVCESCGRDPSGETVWLIETISVNYFPAGNTRPDPLYMRAATWVPLKAYTYTRGPLVEIILTNLYLQPNHQALVKIICQ